MGEFTAQGVLRGGSVNDIYNSVERSKREQINSKLQADGQANALYGMQLNAASQIANPSQQQEMRDEAASTLNRQRQEAGQYVAKGTMFRTPDGKSYYNNSANPIEDALNIRLTEAADAQAAILNSGGGVNDATRFDSKNPGFPARQAVNEYSRSKTDLASSIEATKRAYQDYLGSPGNPLFAAAHNTARDNQAKAEARVRNGLTSIISLNDEKTMGNYGAFTSEEMNRQDLYNQIQNGEVPDVSYLRGDNSINKVSPSTDFGGTMTPEEERSYRDAREQNGWFGNLWNNITGRSPAISKTPGGY